MIKINYSFYQFNNRHNRYSSKCYIQYYIYTSFFIIINISSLIGFKSSLHYASPPFPPVVSSLPQLIVNRSKKYNIALKIFLIFSMNILLENKFLFITKQEIFIFLDKLFKVIEVKKDLTKFIFNFCNLNFLQ